MARNEKMGDTVSRQKYPLAGLRVVVTHPRTIIREVSGPLSELGAEVWEIPVLRIEPPKSYEDLDDVIMGLNSYDWLVFTTPEGVDAFFDRFFSKFEDLRDLGPVKIAAVGAGTVRRIQALHLKVDVTPADELGDVVASALDKYQNIVNLKVCILRAETGDDELPKAIEGLGAIVDDVYCYRLVKEDDIPEDLAEKLEKVGADWIVFGMPAAVEFFNVRFDLRGLLARFPNMKIASMTPAVTRTIRALGIDSIIEAPKSTVESLSNSIKRHVRGLSGAAD